MSGTGDQKVINRDRVTKGTLSSVNGWKLSEVPEEGREITGWKTVW